MKGVPEGSSALLLADCLQAILVRLLRDTPFKNLPFHCLGDVTAATECGWCVQCMGLHGRVAGKD